MIDSGQNHKNLYFAPLEILDYFEKFLGILKLFCIDLRIESSSPQKVKAFVPLFPMRDWIFFGAI